VAGSGPRRSLRRLQIFCVDALVCAIVEAGTENSVKTGVDDLLELKKASVSDSIVAAMLETSKR
jgi:hypothetical protein